MLLVLNLLAFDMYAGCNLVVRRVKANREATGTRDQDFRSMQVLTAMFVPDD